MFKKNKILVYIGIALIVGILIYFVYKYYNKPKQIESTKPTSTAQNSATISAPIDLNKVYSFGDKGEGVKMLQTEINNYLTRFNLSYPAKLVTDGIFGNDTKTAILQLTCGALSFQHGATISSFKNATKTFC